MSATETASPRLSSVLDVGPIAVAPAPEGRATRVVLCRIEPRSVCKVSALFYLCLWLTLLVAGVVLWVGAAATGVIGNVEAFVRDAGFNGFRFQSGALLRAVAIGGVILVVSGTVANLLLVTLFNLMSDLVGGVRVTFIEDRPPRRGR